MSLKKDIQTMAYLQEKEQEAKTLQEQQQQELEQLKKDVILLIDGYFMEILDDEEQKKGLYNYYIFNKYEIIDNIYYKLINIKTKEKQEKSGNVNGCGVVKYKYNYILKYKDYNAGHLREFIADLLDDYIRKKAKETKEEQKAKEEETTKKIFDYLVNLYNIANCESFLFYEVLTRESTRENTFTDLKLSSTLDNLKAYKKAVASFKGFYCIGNKPKAQRKQKGGGLLYGLAIALGVAEGLTKSKKRR